MSMPEIHCLIVKPSADPCAVTLGFDSFDSLCSWLLWLEQYQSGLRARERRKLNGRRSDNLSKKRPTKEEANGHTDNDR